MNIIFKKSTLKENTYKNTNDGVFFFYRNPIYCKMPLIPFITYTPH